MASGDVVEVVLEEGKFMPGLIEGLVGSKAGDIKEIRVQFPVSYMTVCIRFYLYISRFTWYIIFYICLLQEMSLHA